MSMRVLASGIDSLYFSVRAPVRAEAWGLLKRAKDRAEHERELAPLDFPLTGQAFLVKPARLARLHVLGTGHELRHQAAIRGWDQRALARQSGVSEATVSRALAGHGVRSATALKLVQALRRHRPVPELELLVQRGSDDACIASRRPNISIRSAA